MTELQTLSYFESWNKTYGAVSNIVNYKGAIDILGYAFVTLSKTTKPGDPMQTAPSDGLLHDELTPIASPYRCLIPWQDGKMAGCNDRNCLKYCHPTPSLLATYMPSTSSHLFLYFVQQCKLHGIAPCLTIGGWSDTHLTPPYDKQYEYTKFELPSNKCYYKPAGQNPYKAPIFKCTESSVPLKYSVESVCACILQLIAGYDLDYVDFDWEHLGQLSDGTPNSNRISVIKGLCQIIKTLDYYCTKKLNKKLKIIYTTRFNTFTSFGYTSDNEGSDFIKYYKDLYKETAPIYLYNLMIYDIWWSDIVTNSEKIGIKAFKDPTVPEKDKMLPLQPSLYEYILKNLPNQSDLGSSKISIGFEPNFNAPSGVNSTGGACPVVVQPGTDAPSNPSYCGTTVAKKVIDNARKNQHVGAIMTWAINDSGPATYQDYKPTSVQCNPYTTGTNLSLKTKECMTLSNYTKKRKNNLFQISYPSTAATDNPDKYETVTKYLNDITFNNIYNTKVVKVIKKEVKVIREGYKEPTNQIVSRRLYN